MKKTLISLLLVVVIISVGVLPVCAATNGACVFVDVSGETDTGYSYTYNSGGGTGGGDFLRMKLRGETGQEVFSLSVNTPFTYAYYEVEDNNTDTYWNTLNETQKEGIILALISYYSHLQSSEEAYIATQAVIWEYISGVRTDLDSLDTSKDESDAWYNAIRNTKAEEFYKILIDYMKYLKTYYLYDTKILLDKVSVYILESATDFSEQALIYFNDTDFSFFDLFLVVGDINRDGRLNIKDATAIQKFLARLTTLDEASLVLADTDKNGRVTIKDSTNIQKYLAGYDIEF
ncbi:MAG: Cys-Gln thioester bond-forming surface protein [Bacteroidales bacterium]|nr:Cys-Gln thioester bond-forming surface protein [Bacteroidales bacterium]